jgi:hypothetical protein
MVVKIYSGAGAFCGEPGVGAQQKNRYAGRSPVLYDRGKVFDVGYAQRGWRAAGLAAGGPFEPADSAESEHDRIADGDQQCHGGVVCPRGRGQRAGDDGFDGTVRSIFG